MPRPKQYASAAERQSAYRERKQIKKEEEGRATRLQALQEEECLREEVRIAFASLHALTRESTLSDEVKRRISLLLGAIEEDPGIGERLFDRYSFRRQRETLNSPNRL